MTYPDLTAAEVARSLGVSRMTVYVYRDKYGLPLGDRGRISRDAFEQWLTTFAKPKRGRPVKRWRPRKKPFTKPSQGYTIKSNGTWVWVEE